MFSYLLLMLVSNVPFLMFVKLQMAMEATTVILNRAPDLFSSQVALVLPTENFRSIYQHCLKIYEKLHLNMSKNY